MKYQTRKKVLILLSDGTFLNGKIVGDREESTFGEVCFNTREWGIKTFLHIPKFFIPNILNLEL
tara:strand:- start:41271 stop:41462 length:192 start_codon:yes stop_codon:yes gene_type:complete